MAWTTPKTWVTGDPLNATTLNTHVRDNLNALNAKAGPYKIAAGSCTVTLAAAAYAFISVTFPITFDVAPFVYVAMASAAAGTAKFVPRTLNVTTTGGDIYVYTGDGSTQSASVTVRYLCIQMLAGAAAGP